VLLFFYAIEFSTILHQDSIFEILIIFHPIFRDSELFVTGERYDRSIAEEILPIA
jgi:hypothetical protein